MQQKKTGNDRCIVSFLQTATIGICQYDGMCAGPSTAAAAAAAAAE